MKCEIIGEFDAFVKGVYSKIENLILRVRSEKIGYAVNESHGVLE
jgi:hypothetical protein